MAAKIDPSLIPPTPNLVFEKALWAAGVETIAGIDEAGRGALAGPVAAAALIFPPEFSIPKALKGVRDSKQMIPFERDETKEHIKQAALAWGVGFASPQEIDAIGIVPATRLAASRALESLHVVPDHLLLDYLFLPDFLVPQTALIKGDQRSLSIAGASVLAKTARDALLCELDAKYPQYGFAKHKGYATAAHRAALAGNGPCPEHRLSFSPIRDDKYR
jgi:ribonuclease HII